MTFLHYQLERELSSVKFLDLREDFKLLDFISESIIRYTINL